MSESLRLERIQDSLLDRGSYDLESLAKLYAQVFAGEPWNEYTVCPASGAFFGAATTPGETCPDDDCHNRLEPAYPLDKTVDYITTELSRPDAALLLVKDAARADELVGFSWGFSFENPEDFVTSKYKTPEMHLAIRGLLRDLDVGTRGLWYLSESGVKNDPNYRGKGLSREFHFTRLEIAHLLGRDAVQRTSALSNMYRTSRRTMAQVMGVEAAINDDNKLYLTGKVTHGVVDTEIDKRVLFARRNNHS